MANERFRSDRERDPIAELARLADRQRRGVPAERRFREETTSGGQDKSPELPPAPQLPCHWDAHEQDGLNEYRGREEVDDADDQHHVTGQDYQDYRNEVPRRRQSRLTLVMAMALRWWVRRAHSATATSLVAQLFQRLFRATTRATNQTRPRPAPANRKARTAAT